MLYYDRRGQSIGLARFVLGLGVFAVMFFIIQQVATPVLDGSKNATTNETAIQGTVWITDAIDLMPAAAMLISLFGVIAYAVFVRSVRR